MLGFQISGEPDGGKDAVCELVDDAIPAITAKDVTEVDGVVAARHVYEYVLQVKGAFSNLSPLV